jgi:hypothetical protein
MEDAVILDYFKGEKCWCIWSELSAKVLGYVGTILNVIINDILF